MVGEIRDAETASIAIQAALTGHLVFSTVHTNDVRAVSRWLIWGLNRSWSLSLSDDMQRLVGRLCDSCNSL